MVHNGKYYIGDLSDPTGIQLQGKRLMSVSPDSAPYCTLTGLSSSGLDTSFRVITDSTWQPGAFSLVQGFTITKGKPSEDKYWPGAALYIVHYFEDTVVIRENIVIENWGAGIFEIEFGAGNTIIENNFFINNDRPGIAVTMFPDEFRIIKDNVIIGNKNLSNLWYNGVGGGIHLESGLTKTALWGKDNNSDEKNREVNSTVVEGNIIMKNRAKYGGGIGFGYNIGGKINRNLIFSNEAEIYGGGIYCKGGMTTPPEKISGSNNIIISNKANIGGAIFTSADSTFLNCTFTADNGNFQDSSGLLYHGQYYDPPHFVMETSNLYYNTYQKDKEVFIDPYADITCLLQGNFWWVTDSAVIDSLIYGPAEFMPFENNPVPNAPGEPTDIYSVLNYNSDYSTIIDSLGGDPDTLYLEITGNDRNSQFQEAAVAILKSNIYPTGIAVALLETDTASGIYRWKGMVKTTSPPDSIRIDDINQTIRVDPNGDTIKIIANMDNSDIFKVYYRCQGGIEGWITSRTFQISSPDPNPFFNKTLIQYELPDESNVDISIYNMLGQKVKNLYSGKQSSGVHNITWNGTNKEGKKLPGGIYFLKVKAGEKEASTKLILMR